MNVPQASPVRLANRRYARRLIAAFAAYAVILIAVTFLLKAEWLTGPLRYVVAALPMVPVLGIPWTVARWLRETDEMQRRVLLESLAMAFAAGSVLTFGYGFLQVAGAPSVSWFAVWPVYAFCWVAATMINKRRYYGDDD